jgi:hypothetical protein
MNRHGPARLEIDDDLSQVEAHDDDAVKDRDDDDNDVQVQ